MDELGEGSWSAMAIGVAIAFAMFASVALAILFGVGLLVRAMLTTFESGAAEVEHWSPRREQYEAPLGPFRASPLNTTSARGAPTWLRVMGGIGVGVGALTTCAFTPLVLLCFCFESKWGGLRMRPR